MMALKRVEEPQPSPDGKWVLFAAVDVDLKANTKTPHVWVVPLNQDSGSHISQNRGDVGHPTSDSSRSGVSHVSPGLRDMGTSAGSKEKEIISDQDADRPRWAPDGKRFAFVSSNENGSQIWIADFDGTTGTVTAKHRLTDMPTEADGELWSPDGKNILFKSDVYPECEGAPEPEAECNAKKVEERKNSKVKAQIFTHLLYRHWNAYKEGKRTHLFVVPADGCGTAHVGAGALTRPAERSSAESNEQGSPARVGAAGPTRDEERSASCSVFRDLTPGDYDAPVFSVGGQDDYAFSPDGQEICYASNHDPEPAISTNNDLFAVPVNFPADATSKVVLAETKDITAENKAADNTPLYSPDGKYIAYRAQQRPGYESDRWRLMLYERKAGKSSNLTETFDRWVGSFTWAGKYEISFAAESEGEAPIYWLMPQACGDRCHPIKALDRYNDNLTTIYSQLPVDHITVTSNMGLLTQMSVGAPSEIFIEDPSSTCQVGIEKLKALLLGQSNEPLPACAVSHARQITHLNEAVLDKVSMSPLETFWFTGAHNDKVQGWLIKPPNFDPNKKYPVKFIIHGGPEVPMGDEWSYRWNFELFAANGYVVVFINFHGSPGYGQKFIDAINGDWGGSPFEDLMKGLDYVEEHYGFIDKDRECALGASYGGWMANWILGHTNRFKCIVSHDGMFNTESAWGDTEELWFNEWEFKGTPYTNREMYRKWSPHLFATNFKTPTLVIHSQLDYRLDVSQGFDLFTTLQREGVPSKMLYFPDEGHWVLKPQNSQIWYKTVNDWVDQWVGK